MKRQDDHETYGEIRGIRRALNVMWGCTQRDQCPLIFTDGTQYGIMFGVTSISVGSTLSSPG